MPYRFILFLILCFAVIVPAKSQTWHNRYKGLPTSSVACYDYTERYGGLICLADQSLLRINKYGDSLWTRPTYLTYGTRTVTALQMIQLSGGDYVVATMAIESTAPYYNTLIIYRIDSNGSVVHKIIKALNENDNEFFFSMDKTDSNGYYVFYRAGDAASYNYIDKYDSTDKLTWSKMIIEDQLVAGRTADDGVAYITNTRMTKLDANGTIVYDNYLGTYGTFNAWYLLGTSDTGYIAYFSDTTTQMVIKVDQYGKIIHQIYQGDFFFFGYGTETSRGDYIFEGGDMNGFYRCDKNLNLLDSIKSPFNERCMFTTRLSPNKRGGAFYALASDSGGTQHVFAANFDSLFNNYRDLRISMYSRCLVPGDTSHLHISFFNNGTSTVDTTAMVMLDTNATFISSTVAPKSISGDTLFFAIDTLKAGKADSFVISIRVDSAVGLGFLMTFQAMSQYLNNIGSSDDTITFSGTTIGSLDPNFKAVNRPYYFTKDKPLMYSIGFQNTGNYFATNIAVTDTIDSHLDTSSLKIVGENLNAPIVTWPADHVVKFSFANIYLPDSISSPEESHGELVYTIKTKDNAQLGDTVRNTAYIFFDHNPPIITNTTTNVISTKDGAIDTGGNAIAGLKDFAIFPNPFTGTITIQLPDTSSQWNVTLTDVSGRPVINRTYSGGVINMNPLIADGLYFMRVTNMVSHDAYLRKVVRVSKQ